LLSGLGEKFSFLFATFSLSFLKENEKVIIPRNDLRESFKKRKAAVPRRARRGNKKAGGRPSGFLLSVTHRSY
jgi:hypothetical protein